MEVTTLNIRGQTRIPQPPSLIPLLSPKSPRNPAFSSSLPSSLSVPQLGLVPPNRTPSGSGPPSQAPVSPHTPQVPSAHTSGGTSLPSLRSLRNLLPFGSGSGKPPSGTPAAASGPSRSPFASFAPVRRSMNVERKNSSQFSRPGDDSDGAVISIAPSPPRQPSPERTRDVSRSADAHAHDSSDPSPLSEPPLDGELGPPVVIFNPEPPLSSELSTILESDLSGLSKHLPALDVSQITDLSGNRLSLSPEASPPLPGTDDDEIVAPDTSVLDLSTSQLKEEVMHALKEKTSTNGWLAGVVVEDVADSRPASRNGREAHEGYVEVEPEESLHLDALDPDLAALLSPNRVRETQQNHLLAVPIPQKPPPPNPPPRIFPPTRAVTPQSRPSPLGSSPIDASPSSATGSARSQPSPVRTTAHPGLVRSVPTRFVPRLMRSATDYALTGRDRGTEGVSRTPSDSALQLDDEARRVSSDGVYIRRPPASPLPLEFQSQPSLQQTHTEQHRRVASSRLATPARFGAHTSGASRLLRSALPSSSASPTGWGGDSPSPTSRASSSLGAAADRLNRPRTSEDGGRPTVRERLGYTPRSRNRSLSVGNKGERVASPAPRTATEWLGPRTAKAFAAAGLLDRDRDRDPSNGSASRFGSVRSLGDRDQRALAPSRLALSEAGSVASSWRSGSVSRAMTHSDMTASTSTGAPRTTRSAESTAPTSMSNSRTPSPQHKTHQAALQAMQEKHAMETGTLLAALADAQHIAQSLRTENAKLNKRVEDLEAQLVAAHHAQLRAQPPVPRSVFSRVERQNSADALAARRWPPPVPALPGYLMQNTPNRVLDQDPDTEDDTYHDRVALTRRASCSESVFALPPPNMSMLLQEQPTGSRRSVSSVSVTTVGAPTDAPGSPRSLFLRPEHELHLGDMGSICTEDEADDEDAL
ncbi:hypothetical protein EI94DRAFT_1737286 [Lactarius quietus]|nr:hypothetical protein EI94DRAFT_1737286 [Lactarius quietus]